MTEISQPPAPPEAGQNERLSLEQIAMRLLEWTIYKRGSDVGVNDLNWFVNWFVSQLEYDCLLFLSTKYGTPEQFKKDLFIRYLMRHGLKISSNKEYTKITYVKPNHY